MCKYFVRSFNLPSSHYLLFRNTSLKCFSHNVIKLNYSKNYSTKTNLSNINNIVNDKYKIYQLLRASYGHV